ncbi:hypothetical protein [Ruegeria atlantica]|uniref:hypothetical protein n=1 Tax=Ruegeria atlantica TaxID=81569 RepID=UPI00147D63DC|nr:hypothetical protein [Ruegeria atlantica]
MPVTLLIKTVNPVARFSSAVLYPVDEPVEESESNAREPFGTVWSTKKISKMNENGVDDLWPNTPSCMGRKTCH